MRLYRSTFTFLAFLALSISCNKKEKEVKPVEKCRFLGRSYNREVKHITFTLVNTYESNFKQDEQGRLMLVTESETELEQDSTGIIASIKDEQTYEFIYDAEGFLIEMKQHGLRLRQASANHDFIYGNFKYRKAREEATRVTTFVYNEGLLQSSKYVSNIVYQRENLPVETVPESYTYLYKYDSKGIVQIATPDGSVTNFVNGIPTSSTSADGKSVMKYDDKGRIISSSAPIDQRIFKYDQRGNQIFQECYDNSVFVFSVETKFDEHTNPDNMVPSRYKGIPVPIKIPYVEGNPNNITESTFNHRNDAPLITSNVWTYHPNGLPATSIMKSGTDFYQETRITKFKYENCD